MTDFQHLSYKNPRRDIKREINTDIVQNIHIYSIFLGIVAHKMDMKQYQNLELLFFFFLVNLVRLHGSR